jgi:hypothetical protein
MQRYFPAGRALTEFGGAPFGMGNTLGPAFQGQDTRRYPGAALRQNAGALLPAAIMTGAQLLGDASIEDKLTRAAGSFAGAIIGTLTGAGPVIGSAIGTSIASVLMDAFRDFQILRADTLGLSPDEQLKQAEVAQKTMENLISPFGALTGIFGDEEKWKKVADSAYQTFKEHGIQKAMDEIEAETPFGAILNRQQIEQSFEARLESEQAIRQRGGRTPTAEDALAQFHKERYDEIAKFNEKVLMNTADMAKKRRAELEKYVTGDITRKEYNDFVKGQEDAINRVGALYRELDSVVDDPLNSMSDKFARMSEETRDELISLVTQINTLEDALAVAFEDTPEEVPAMEKEINELKNALASLYQLAQTQGQEPFKFKGFSDYSDYTQAEFDEIIEKAKELQDAYFDYLDIPEEVWKESIDAWVALTKDGYDQQEDVFQQFVQMVKSQMDEAKKASENFNLQRLKDISPDKIPELERLVRYWETSLSNIPGYSDQAESQPFNLLFGEENVAHRLVTTQEALRFAIEDLTEVEKKQLEGMWNIPEGATVMVPLQSLYYAPKGGGALQVPETPGATFGGETTTGITGLDQPASKMDMAGDKMLSAAEMQLQQGGMWSKAVEAFPEGFGPEESMWGKAKRMWPQGGFGPQLPEDEEAQKKILDAIDPMKGIPQDFLDGRQIGADMAATFQPNLEVKVPDIVANITMNIPQIRLNGRAVSQALRVNQTARLTSEARTRGAAGGGVIQ